MRKYITAATSNGNQPPSGTFTIFAEKNERSIIRKNITSARAELNFHFHNSLMATKASNDVITIVVLTATPYADARLSEVLKKATNPVVAINNIQFKPGI